MRRTIIYCALFCALVALLLCGRGRRNLVGVSFPEPPVEIATNADFGMGLINMYNILRLPDGTYRMYFIANPQNRRMKLYSRITQERYKNRRVTVAEFNLRGQQVSDTEILASPGFVEIGGKRYLAYNARTRSHENSRTGMESRYKLIPVELEYE